MFQASQRHSSQTYFAAEYDTALNRFRALRDEYGRKTSCGREFVIVSEVTRRLRKRSEAYNHGSSDHYCSDLEHLRITAHHAHFSYPPDLHPEDLDKYLSVFYILIELGCPQHIRLFLDRGLDDQHLPIALEDLKSKISLPPTSDEDNFHESFFREQYRWSPMVFDLNMGGNDSKHDPVIPLYRKEKIEPRRGGSAPGHISTLWKVEVPEELVTERLRDKIANAQIQRQVEGTDEIATVKPPVS